MLNNEIRRLLNQKSIFGVPSNNDGKDGDLRLCVTNEGKALYGKIKDEWFKFGSGQKVGFRQRHSSKEKTMDFHSKRLDVSGD